MLVAVFSAAWGMAMAALLWQTWRVWTMDDDAKRADRLRGLGL